MGFSHLTNDAEAFRNAVIDTNKEIQAIEEFFQTCYSREAVAQFYKAQEKLNDLYRGKY